MTPVRVGKIITYFLAGEAARDMCLIPKKKASKESQPPLKGGIFWRIYLYLLRKMGVEVVGGQMSRKPMWCCVDRMQISWEEMELR